ncbi:TPA: hypothetical protein DIC39_02190 [Patescibacteria group bacterium]|nr:hypothetical protein [Patescibacteria group bacterium]
MLRPNLDNLSISKKSLPQPADRGGELARIYRGGRREDFTTLRRRAAHQRAWLYLTVFLLVAIALVGVWFFFFSSNQGKFGEETVTITFTGPTQAPSGQTVEYEVVWDNDQGVALKSGELNFRYPEGFTVLDANLSALDDNRTRFDIGGVGAREGGKLKLTGQLVGEVGDIKEFTVVFTYEPTNFRGQFATNSSLATELVASVLNLSLETPPQLPIDQDLILKVTYNNTSANDLSNLAIRFTAPGGFELDLPSADPVVGQDNLWRLPDLTPKSEGTLALVGRFTDASISGEQTFTVAIGIIDGDNNFTVQEEKTAVVNAIESHLTLTLTANQVAIKSFADWGEQIDFELRYANEGEANLNNVVLRAQLNTTLLDWTTWQADTVGSVDEDKGEVIWSKQTVAQLNNLAPGAKGSIHFRLTVVDTAPGGSTGPYSFDSKIATSAQQTFGTTTQTVTSESNAITTKINTQLALQVEGRYYTDQLVKIGSGPLPPRVGNTTTYVIFWRLANTINDAANIEVTTTLPQDINWTGQATVSAGQNVVYNPNTREVVWQINKLPAGAGIQFARPEASFEVAITPTEQDADKILVLTKATTVTARDSWSGADLITTAKLVTTELDNDLGAQGKGVVAR